MTADERINALLERAGCPVMVVKDIEDAECLGYLLPTLRVIDTPMYGGSYGKFMKHLVDTIDRLEVALENALNERDFAADTVRNITALDVAQIVTNGQDTTYLRVKSLDGLRGRIVIDEESGNRCAMYYEEAEDFAPVVHARWIDMQEDEYTEGMWRCSACKSDQYFDSYLPSDCDIFYCPNCGARMDGEADA